MILLPASDISPADSHESDPERARHWSRTRSLYRLIGVALSWNLRLRRWGQNGRPADDSDVVGGDLVTDRSVGHGP